MITAFILPAYTLWRREMVRFFRQKSRIIGAIFPPLIFWFFIGSGLGDSFQHAPGSQTTYLSGINYLQYFFPGTVILVVLFTAIFSTISIIEDRKEGFLQSVLTAPVSNFSIVFGKISGGSTLAFIHGLFFLLLAPTLGITFRFFPMIYIFLMLFLIAVGLTGLGFFIAWQMDSTQGFHSVMNLFLMPLWFLSGALFPMEGAPWWLAGLMVLNPLAYGVSGLRYGCYSSDLLAEHSFPSPIFSLGIVFLFSLFVFSLSLWVCSHKNRRN